MTAAGLFLHGDWIWALVLAPAVWLLLRLRDRARQTARRRVLGSREHVLARETSATRRSVRRAALGLGFAFALVAALGPLLGEAEGEAEWRGVDLVVCLDVSRSMLARDLLPSRLERAKSELRSLAERTAGDRLGLVVFAGDARLRVPLTKDRATFTALADQADPTLVGRGGTDLGAALTTALGALEGSASEHSVILLLTDGEDLGARGAAVAAACRRRGVIVHGVGLGTARGSKIVITDGGGESFLRDRSGREVLSRLDASSLRRIADVAGGDYLAVAAPGASLVTLYEDAILPMARRAVAGGEARHKENRFQWPLLAAFLLMLVFLGVSDRGRA